MDASGGMVRGFDSSFRDSSDRKNACIHTFLWVPAPGGGAPFVVLEQISNDQGSALLIKSILELQRLQLQVSGRIVKPVRVNIDMGLALLVASVQSWNNETVEQYIAFGWAALRTKGFVDWSGRTIVSFCRTHMSDAIKQWTQTTLRFEPWLLW